MEMQASPSSLSLSPSFSSHSSDKLAEIAARVIQEFSTENYSEPDQGCTHSCEEFRDQESRNFEEKCRSDERNDEGEGEEFEFPLLAKDSIAWRSPADEIFYNGEILPIYPVFNTKLALDGDGFLRQSSLEETMELPPENIVRLPLGVLFRKDRETTSSSFSSSDVDELDEIPPGTYCVWKPNSVSAEAEEGRWRKSTSTGSLKQWRLRDLIHRSSSDGRKDRFVFSTPVNKKEEKVGRVEKSKVVGKDALAAEEVKSSGERRRPSSLPYLLA